MPLHRKRTYRPKVLAAALGVGLTISGVAYAAQMEPESVSSAPAPVPLTSSPASPGSSAAADRPGDAHPSQSARTRSAMRAKAARERAEQTAALKAERKAERRARQDRRKKSLTQASPSVTQTAEPTRPAAPETSSAASEPARQQTTAPRTRRPASEAPSSGRGILGGTNAARGNAGLPALGTSACLARMAQRHAERLAGAGTLYHQNLGNVMSSCGMSTAGENVAMNSSQPGDMVRQWLNSPGHRANMLSSRFSLIGIGVARASDGAWFGVQVFGDR